MAHTLRARDCAHLSGAARVVLALRTTMAPPMPRDPHERTTTEPHSGTRSNLPPPPRLSPDEEAVRLLMEVTRRAQVAHSFARLAGSLLTVSAAHASLQLRATAEAKVAEMRRLAHAAKDAAVHVATHRPARAPDDAPETLDAPVAPRTAE